MPSASYPDLRKVRRWLRNVTELYSIQNYLVGEVERIRNSIDYGQLRDRHWMGRIRKGVLPPTIRDLYSAYNYLNLHMRPAPMREEWADRYNKILGMMDRGGRIRGARDEAGRLLKAVVEESEKASREVGELLRTLFDMVLKGAKALG